MNTTDFCEELNEISNRYSDTRHALQSHGLIERIFENDEIQLFLGVQIFK